MADKELTILLVEDDEVDVAHIKRCLHKLHIVNPLYVASDGLVALHMLKGTHGMNKIPAPALILLDINMPRMSGLEFLAEIRKDKQLHHLSIVVLTTSDEEKDIVKAYNFNVSGYILKPIEPENFFEILLTIEKYWKLCEQLPEIHGK